MDGHQVLFVVDIGALLGTPHPLYLGYLKDELYYRPLARGNPTLPEAGPRPAQAHRSDKVPGARIREDVDKPGTAESRPDLARRLVNSTGRCAE